MGDVGAHRSSTSSRDRGALAERLRAWFTTALAADRLAEIVSIETPGKAGLSSETLLVELRWQADGAEHEESYVVRLPPSADAFPLFPGPPWYDLDRQARAMRLVREHTEVPVPAVVFAEPDPSVLGAPFFVMTRLEGEVVPDVPPYVFGGWVTEASPEELATMTGSMVDVLAGIHGADADLGALELAAPGATPLERHVANQRAYYEWIRGDGAYPTVNRAFAWLDGHWPTEGEAVLSWGDARLANVLWRDFRPVAVLDWEAVAVGPRELDLAWLVFFHEYFQRLAGRYGYEGAPDLLRGDEVVAAYEARTGHEVADFDWYLVYAELRQALTSIRVSGRRVHLGELDPPDDPEDLIMERDHLERLLDS